MCIRDRHPATQRCAHGTQCDWRDIAEGVLADDVHHTPGRSGQERIDGTQRAAPRGSQSDGGQVSSPRSVSVLQRAPATLRAQRAAEDVEETGAQSHEGTKVSLSCVSFWLRVFALASLVTSALSAALRVLCVTSRASRLARAFGHEARALRRILDGKAQGLDLGAQGIGAGIVLGFAHLLALPRQL